MAVVDSYKVSFYGGPSGYQDVRAQIELHDAAGQPIGWLRFHDRRQPIPADSQIGGVIEVHYPGAMFESVIDVLRNEGPLAIDNSGAVAIFSTENFEPVGEGE
ncbi:MAG: hypothetical protein Q9M25_03400 [Mariprofundaceae bacterium]|nr:hypothetical protein [Mariprofundaceae bacterium]